MTPFERAFVTSVLLAEKIASARPASNALMRRQALADFATFGLFKQGAIDRSALSALQRGLGWGVGLGLPALGVGHLLERDARRQGEELLRDARNQALLTAAGVGGMQALGDLLKKAPPPTRHDINVSMPSPDVSAPKLAAAVMVDDVLEAACGSLDDGRAKQAALVRLVLHRVDGTRILRGLAA